MNGFPVAPLGDGDTETRTALESEVGLRVDIAVARWARASRGAVAEAIKRGSVRINGTVPKPSTALEEGDRVDFAVAKPLDLTATAEDLPLDIVFEDDAIMVVNKVAGMVTHPAHGARDGTLVNALLAHAQNLPGDALRPGLVHRLDRDTSGLLVVAKTERALRALGLAMQRHFIQREYLGIVVGIPEHPQGTIEGAIGRDERNRLRYAIRADGKPAVTHYEVRERLNGASELRFRLETGRTHQIRVHMKAFGHPIFNDPIYGKIDARTDLPGQALHAWKLRFRHPESRAELAFEVPPPPEYLGALALLRPA